MARPAPGKQAHAIVKRLLEYDRRSALLADFEEAMSDLVPEASATRFEQGLAELGTHLGFDVERPEKVHGIGPDVLWRTEAVFDFVIEAKNEKEGDSPLYKKDHAQLLEAEHWFKQAYPDRESVRVSALPEALADDKATPVGSFAFRLDEVTKVVSALREILAELVGASGDVGSLREQCEAALVKAKLKPSALRDNFMKPFGKAKTKDEGAT